MFIDLLGYPIDKPPSLTELLQMNIPLLVGRNYHRFGICLLNDESGKRVEVIMDNHRGDAEGITTQILKEWINEKPQTWETLISTLRECNIGDLTDTL